MTDEEFGFRYQEISVFLDSIRYNPELVGNVSRIMKCVLEKFLIGDIVPTKDSVYIIITNKEVADSTGLSPSTIRKYLTVLQDLKYIKVARVKGYKIYMQDQTMLGFIICNRLNRFY